MTQKKILLFAPYGLWTVHHQLDAVVGGALKMRGANVLAVCCDGILKNCPIADCSDQEKICKQCFATSAKLFESTQIPTVTLGALVDKEDIGTAKDWVETIAPEKLPEATYKNATIELGKWVSSGVYSRNTTSEHNFSDSDVVRLYRDYVYDGALIATGLEKLFDEFQPDHLICYSGMHVFYRIAFMLARKRNIKTLVHERGRTNDSFLLLENNTLIMYQSRIESWEQWKHVPLKKSELKWARDYVNDRESGRNFNWHSPYECASDAAKVRKVLRIPESKKIVTIFPSSDWEYGILRDDCRITFHNQIEGLKQIISSLSPEKYAVVIRLHPPMGFSHLDYGRRFMEEMFDFSLQLPEYVRLISPLEEITAYALLWVSDCVITFGSTVGLEALFKGVAATSTICNINSAVIEWTDSPVEYSNTVEQLIRKTQHFDENDLRVAYRAMYHLYNRVNFKFASFGIRDHVAADIRITSLKQLSEGNDSDLDQVCRHILNNEPLYPLPPKHDNSVSAAEENVFIRKELSFIKDARGKFRTISKEAKEVEPSVAIVRIRQNGVRDDQDTIFAQSAKRFRYKNIEWQRMFEIALPPGFDRDAFLQEMEAAIYQAKSEYICFGIDHFQFDEAWISTAVDFLEASENRDVDGVLTGAWICDSNGKAVDELFCKNKNYDQFSSLCLVLPDSQNPASFFGLFLCRKEAWKKLITQLSQRDLSLKDIPESIFNLAIGKDAILRIHKLQIPLIVIHTPQSGKALSEKGVACGAKGQWQKAATFLKRATDTGYQDPVLDFWKIACLARLGKKHEAGIMSLELLVGNTITDQRQLDVLNSLASQVHPGHLKFEDIEQSVQGIEGWLVEGQEKYLFNKVKSLPDGAVIVEIGSCYGRSTAAMAYACWGTRKKIIAIDTFLGNTDGGSRIKGNSFYDVWERNIRQRGLMNYVTAMPGYSHEQLACWDRKQLIDFVFIDASHLYKDVIKELDLVYPLVKPGGWIALHDVDPAWPGPWRVWRETCAATLSSHEYASTLACGQKQPGVALYIPKDSQRYDYSQEWVKHLRPMIPQITNAMETTLNISIKTDQNTLTVAEHTIGAMPDHPLLRFAMREMIKLEAGCDPYLHYWNALTHLHDGQYEDGKKSIHQALAKGPSQALKERLSMMLSRLGEPMQNNIQQVASKNSDNYGGYTIAFINTYYPKFIQSHYARHHELAKTLYDEQIQSLNSQRFGDSDFYSTGMLKAGWHAADFIVNCDPLQSAWATENGYVGQGLEIAVEQIRQLGPDVVYLQDLSLATKEFLSRIREFTRLIVGQIASPLPANVDIKEFDIIFSSFPHFVERFRKAGITSYYQPLAFAPGILDTIDTKEKIHDATFIGGVSPAHEKGLKLLEAVAGNVPVDFWGYGAEQLPVDSIIRNRHHGEAWGLKMFNTMAQSRITINRHIDVAENYANNMRLFEATGCGALLITDFKDNLNDLFEIGTEVVAYRSSEECAALVKYYLQNPEEAAAIARNGQKRTLKEHTYDLRMQNTAEILSRHLRYRRDTLPAPNLNEISYGYQTIQAGQVTEKMTKAWQDSSIPVKQRALVQLELMDMYHGKPPVVYQVLSEILRSVTRNGSSMLEIGCASGYYYEVIEYLLSCNIAYTGVDYSEPLVSMAKEYYDRPNFHVADGACLPFKDRKFEIAVSSGILLHVPNYDQHITETVRVANSFVVFHRTPICRQRPTQYLKKQAYGVETVELRFNENELMELILAQGVKFKGYIEYSAEQQKDQFEVTYLFEKQALAFSADMNSSSRFFAGNNYKNPLDNKANANCCTQTKACCS